MLIIRFVKLRWDQFSSTKKSSHTSKRMGIFQNTCITYNDFSSNKGNIILIIGNLKLPINGISSKWPVWTTEHNKL